MKSKKSLRNGINLIFLIVWLIIFMIQIVYIYTMYRKSVNDTQATFSNTMISAHAALEKKIHTATQLSKVISNDIKTIEYFQCADENQRKILWQNTIEPLQVAYNMTAEQFYAFSFDPSKNLIASSDSPSLQLVYAVHETYEAFKTNNEPLSFYSISDTPFTDMFFFLFCDITTPDPDHVGIKNLGTIAIAGRINKDELIRQIGLNEKIKLAFRYCHDEKTDVVLTSGTSDTEQLFWEESVSDTNWNLYGCSDIDTPITTGIILLALETMFMSGLFVLMQQFVKKNIFIPLNKISEFLKHYSLTQKNQRINLHNKTEIGNVADKIDEMVGSIETLSRSIIETQQKLYESEIAKKDASLYALQAQLNPHFLYNTLDCICGIANVFNAPLIPDITSALAKMLRYNLSEGNDVPLIREIELVKNYLTIMEARRPDCFTTEFHINSETENLIVPKMLLQPIIENIFIHGLDDYIHDARIIISAKSENNYLLITISDNGCGISEDNYFRILLI